MRTVLIMFVGLSAIWLAGCGGSGGSGTALCADPAPVSGTHDPQLTRYIVKLSEEVDFTAEANRLAANYGFEVQDVLEGLRLFVAEFSTDVLEQLRCEPSVVHITYDEPVYPN
jgi:hypothetical protein